MKISVSLPRTATPRGGGEGGVGCEPLTLSVGGVPGFEKSKSASFLIVRRDVDFLWAGLFGGDSPPVNVMSPFFLLL